MKKLRDYRRRNYLVDKRYQGKFVITIIGICAFGMFIALATFNYLSYKKLDSVLWGIHIDKSTIGEIIRPYLIYSNIFAIVLTTLILIAFSRFALHKTAPPLFRLKRYIEHASQGNLNITLDWLVNDEFKKTAEELNRMVASMRDKFKVIKEKAKTIETTSHVLGHVLDKPDLSAEKCRSLIEDLQSLKEKLMETGKPERIP